MAGETVALDLAQRAERLRERDLRIGPVQQEKIDLAHAQPGDRFAGGAFERPRCKMRRPHFRRDEELVASHPRGADALAHFAFIVVDLRRIDMPVAQPQRLFDNPRAGAPAQLPGAEADQRDFCSVGLKTWYRYDRIHLSSSRSIPLRRLRRTDYARIGPPEPADFRHFGIAQREREAAEIFGQALALRGARDRNDPLLFEITQRHLRRRLAVGPTYFLQRRVAGHFAARQRTIADHRHAVASRGRNDFALVEIGMRLNLQHRDRLARDARRLVDHRNIEIGDANVFGKPGLLDFAERGNRVFQRNLRVGPVNHQQVDPGQTKLLQAYVDRALEIARRQAIEPDLGGEKHVFTLEPAAAQARSDLALVAIHLRGVEMPVAELQSGLDQLHA